MEGPKIIINKLMNISYVYESCGLKNTYLHVRHIGLDEDCSGVYIYRLVT